MLELGLNDEQGELLPLQAERKHKEHNSWAGIIGREKRPNEFGRFFGQ